MLRVANIVKDYGGQRVLDGASLVLKPGERAALVAPNGAGKSTLLKIIAGIEDADSGHVALPQATVVGYLAQDAGVQPGRSLHDEVLSAVADLLAEFGFGQISIRAAGGPPLLRRLLLARALR